MYYFKENARIIINITRQVIASPFFLDVFFSLELTSPNKYIEEI